MKDDITGHFDGRAIISDHPLELKAGQKQRVRIVTIGAKGRDSDAASTIEQTEDNIPRLAQEAVPRAYQKSDCVWPKCLDRTRRTIGCSIPRWNLP